MEERSAGLTPEALLAHANWLRRLAGSLVAASEAEDLAQDTWVVALERGPRADSPAGLRAWFESVLRNLVHRRRRDRSIRAWHHERAAKGEAIEDAIEQRADLQQRLARAVYSLDEPYRSAIVLRYFDELSPREIAAKQGVSYDAARQRVSRGLSMLRAELDRDCEGGRAVWSALCLSLVGKLPTAPGALTTGGLIVGAKAWSSMLALALVAAVSWWWVRSASEPATLDESSRIARPAVEMESPGSGSSSPSSQATIEMSREAVAPASSEPREFARAIDRERDLHGIVVDSSDRRVAGARIEVAHNEFTESDLLDLANRWKHVVVAETRSDERGEFAVPLEPARAYALDVTAEGFAVARLEHRRAGERVVVRLEPGASIFGRISRSEDGSAVGGARVRLARVQRSELNPARTAPATVSDAGGRYRFDGVAAGEYTVQVYPKSDSCSPWLRVELRGDEKRELDIRVEPGFTLRGRVLDFDTGDPIAGASVGEGWVAYRSTETDWNGEFEFAGFSSTGYYDISVRAPGYGRIDQTVRDPDGPVPEKIEVRLRRARELRGRALDAQGEPIEGVYVAAIAYGPVSGPSAKDLGDQVDWESARSGSDGRFEIRSLRSDIRHTLYLKKEGFGIASYPLPAREALEPMLDVGDVVLRPPAIVRGVVVDENDAPVADQTVEFSGWNADHNVWRSGHTGLVDSYVRSRTSRSDDLGRFSFGDVAAGEYSLLAVREDSHDRKAVAVVVTEGATVDFGKLVVPRGLSIRGRVLGPSGKGVPAYVSVDPVDGIEKPSGDVRTMTDGSFEASGLEAGDYRVTVWPESLWGRSQDGIRIASSRLDRVAAGTHDVVIRCPIAERIGGRVVDSSGAPIKGCFVSAVGPGEVDGQGDESGADGRFELWLPGGRSYDIEARPQVPSDRYYVGVEPTSDPSKIALIAGVDPGGPEIELRLP